MPVRRKMDRHKPAELAVWRDWFAWGHCFFGHLLDAGITTDRIQQPDEATARAAWQRCGDAFLAEYAEEQSRERYPSEKPLTRLRCSAHRTGGVVVPVRRRVERRKDGMPVDQLRRIWNLWRQPSLKPAENAELARLTAECEAAGYDPLLAWC